MNDSDNSVGFHERYLDRMFKEHPALQIRDRAFTVHLVQGVLRWRLRLDWLIEQMVHFPFKNIEEPVLNILRICLYQIFFMDRVPDSAAVNEAVKQTAAMGRGRLVGVVNGILRQICRKRGEITFPDPDRDAVRYLSVFYSYPVWLVSLWIKDFGIAFTEKLLAAGNRIPRLCVRSNLLRTDRPSAIRSLADEGLKVSPTRYSPEGIHVQDAKGIVSELGPFHKGLIQVQDEAAQVCSHLLSPQAGETILDIGAGLGGKSTHMAELSQNKAWIVSLDSNHGRLVRLVQNSGRLGIDCIHPLAADASKRLSAVIPFSFDKIMVDGPCSALGILARHPDGKWTKDQAHVNRLADLQLGMLNQAAPLLRKGGKMLYVTCTISRPENDQVVSAFINGRWDMHLEDLKDHIPRWGRELIDDHGFFRTFPHVHGMDGFFAALFTKKQG